jgi:hypothetical protein
MRRSLTTCIATRPRVRERQGPPCSAAHGKQAHGWRPGGGGGYHVVLAGHAGVICEADGVGQLRDANDSGVNLAVCARHLAKTMRSKSRRGRRGMPFRITDRSDGRFPCSVTTRPFSGVHARELLERLAPLLRKTADRAGIPSVDAFMGLPRMDERPLRARRTKERNSLLVHDWRRAIAAKWQSISAAIQHLREVAQASRWLAPFDRQPRRSTTVGGSARTRTKATTTPRDQDPHRTARHRVQRAP